MPSNRKAYRRSIWDFDPRYDCNLADLSQDDLNDISLLRSIEAAKKQIPPATFHHLREIRDQLRRMPSPDDMSSDEFAQILRATVGRGIGVKIAICMIAVWTHGQYAPLDNKIINCLARKGKLTKSEATRLNQQSSNPDHLRTVALIYIAKVLPLWRRQMKTAKSAKDLDNRWAQCP